MLRRRACFPLPWPSVALRGKSTAPGAQLNWGENVHFTHDVFEVPEVLADVQRACRDADKLRVLGSGHSFSDVCCSEGTLLSMAYMRNILDMDVERMQVVVEGGATIGDVVKYLGPRGAALTNIPSLPHVSVAGALATATHGSGLREGLKGGLPGMCAEIDFVIHDGSVVTYKRGDCGFDDAIVHLGALGVVSRVALDIVPSYEVAQHVYTHAHLVPVIEQFRTLAEGCDSLTLGINFASGETTVWRRFFCREEGTPPPQGPPNDLGVCGGHLQLEGIPFYELDGGCVATTRIGAWHDVPSFFMDDGKELNMPNVAVQSEFFVDLKDASNALLAVKSIAQGWPEWTGHSDVENQGGTPVVFHCEVRAVGKDGLGGVNPFGDRDSCSIHFTWGDSSRLAKIMPLLHQLERVLSQFGARPHWGKLNTTTADDLMCTYRPGALRSFRSLCDKHDPRGKFRNAYVDNMLPA